MGLDRSGKFLTDPVLTEPPDGQRDGSTDALTHFSGQPLQLLVSRDVDPYAGALHAYQTT